MFDMKISLKSRVPKYMRDEYALDDFENGVMDNVKNEALAEWEDLAKATMGDAAEAYISNIRVEQDNPRKLSFYIDDPLSNMRENGAPPFDMKPGLLKGQDKVTIGMSHGSPKLEESNPLPAKVFSKAKYMKMGQRFTDTSRRKKSFKGYKHTTGIYSGMMKQTKSAKKEYGGSFVTFRTISRNSPARSWWHPGFKALHLADRVKRHIEVGFDGILNKVKMKVS